MFRREIYRTMEPILSAMTPEALRARNFALGGTAELARLAGSGF